jgi:DNA-nicking Smr family endonuclease
MSRRRLSDDEHSLWKGVTRSIKPLRRRVEASDAASDVAPAAPVKAQPRPSPVAPSPVVRAKENVPSKPSPPPLAPLGRRVRKRVARGSQMLDGRLDLHGLTQAEAHHALLGFLRRTQARGGRLVLVITGKGRGEATAERGVLKRQVPQWLTLPEFRGMVVGFESAGIGHGGEGALYVSLRRPRDQA